MANVPGTEKHEHDGMRAHGVHCYHKTNLSPDMHPDREKDRPERGSASKGVRGNPSTKAILRAERKAANVVPSAEVVAAREKRAAVLAAVPIEELYGHMLESRNVCGLCRTENSLRAADGHYHSKSGTVICCGHGLGLGASCVLGQKLGIQPIEPTPIQAQAVAKRGRSS